MTSFFCFWPLGVGLHGWRKFHFDHHRFVGTPADPELGIKNKHPKATTVTPTAIGIGLLVYVVKTAALAVFIGVIERMFAKLRLFRVTDLLGVAFILALLGLLFFYILRS